MLTDAQIAEIKKRAETSYRSESPTAERDDVDALIADRDELVRMGDLHRGEIAELVRRLAKVIETWDDNWDCYLSPGHDAMNEAVAEAWAAIEPAPPVAAALEDAPRA